MSEKGEKKKGPEQKRGGSGEDPFVPSSSDNMRTACRTVWPQRSYNIFNNTSVTHNQWQIPFLTQNLESMIVV